MNESLHLGRIGGTRVGVNWSLIPIVALVVWSLASVQLPGAAPGYDRGAYWVAGALTAIAFFASLLAHELSHAAVARRRGMQVKGIVLWLFGGVAQAEGEMPDARAELHVAVVGPGTSLAIAAVAGAAAWLLDRAGLSPLFVTSLAWLGAVNALLGIFNLLPAFPLDGGRVLRALLWRHWGDRLRATSLASVAGRGIGFALVAVGGLEFLTRRGSVGGLWLALVGWFVAGAAAQQQRQAAVETRLGRIRVCDAMSRNPVVVPAEASVGEVVERFVRTSRFSAFPVGDTSGRIVGLTTVVRMREVPAERRWATPVTTVAATPADMVICSADEWLGEVAARMDRSRDRRALVIDAGRLVGIVAPSDIAHAMGRAQLIDHSDARPDQAAGTR